MADFTEKQWAALQRDRGGLAVSAPARRRTHTPNEMNKLETRYAQHLQLRKMAGEIAEWKFEPLKLKLAPATFYNPDFLVKMPNGTMELHETKGFWEDDARVKIKVAAQAFKEFFRVVAVKWDKNLSDWSYEWLN